MGKTQQDRCRYNKKIYAKLIHSVSNNTFPPPVLKIHLRHGCEGIKGRVNKIEVDLFSILSPPLFLSTLRGRGHCVDGQLL